MTPTLTLAECKKLKEWGLEQGPGDYYGFDGHVLSREWFDGLAEATCADLDEIDYSKLGCRIPTESELREFVMKKWAERIPAERRHYLRVEWCCEKTPRVLAYLFQSDSEEDTWTAQSAAPTVSAALYALALKICGGEK